MSSQRRRKLGPLLVSLALVYSFGALVGQALAQRMPEAAKGPSVAWRTPAQGNPGDYVGWESCAGCGDHVPFESCPVREAITTALSGAGTQERDEEKGGA